jgi:hypothetical protein
VLTTRAGKGEVQRDFLIVVFDRTTTSQDVERQRKRHYFSANLDTSESSHHHIVKIIAARIRVANMGRSGDAGARDSGR